MKQNSSRETAQNSSQEIAQSDDQKMTQSDSQKVTQSDGQKMMQEAIIKLAAKKYVESEGEKILEEARALNAEEGGGPSEEQRAAFENLLDRELKKQRRKAAGKNRMVYKVAAVAAVVLVVVNITIASVPAVRLAVLKMLTKQYQEYSRIESDPSGKSESESASEKYDFVFDKEYEVTYLPEGFEMVEYEKSSEGITINYLDEENNLITFWQNVNHAASYIDTEESDTGYIDINGNQSIINKKGSDIAITLEIGNCFISLDGHGVSEEELIQVAKSIQEVK